MKEATQRVVTALAAAGVQADVVEFAESTRTAVEAAAAVGTTVGQIVKSLVFLAGDEPVMALVSGANRLDQALLAAHVGQPVRRASAGDVRTATGYAIGGVPPVGLVRPLAVYIDRDLTAYETVYAAAGTPHTVFPIASAALVRATGGVVLDLAAQERESE